MLWPLILPIKNTLQVIGRFLVGESNPPLPPFTPPPAPIPGWTPSTPPVTSETFNALIQKNHCVAVHFWAPWNGTEPKMDEAIHHAANSFPHPIHFASCDTSLEENKQLGWQLAIAAVPTLVVFVNGKATQPIIGCRSADDLKRELLNRLQIVSEASS